MPPNAPVPFPQAAELPSSRPTGEITAPAGAGASVAASRELAGAVITFLWSCSFSAVLALGSLKVSARLGCFPATVVVLQWRGLEVCRDAPQGQVA